MSALQGNACLKRMTPSPNPSDAAVIEAFAGIPGLLEQAPALIARGRALDCECMLGYWKAAPRICPGTVNPIRPSVGPMSENPEQFRRYIAPVLTEILKQSTTSTKQGVHV